MHLLEEAAFAAWPALEEADHAGWRLRCAQGYTKRANSANATTGAAELDAARIAHVEAFYRSRKLAPVFRLASFCTPAASDDALAARGYRYTDFSLVMSAALDPPGAEKTKTETETATVDFLPDAQAWLHAYMQVSGETGPSQHTHLRMLQAIADPCAFAVMYSQGEPVCCGLGVRRAGPVSLFGLFDIATHPGHRRRGLAGTLCAALMERGRRQGAGTAYLQVGGTNAQAIHLYESLGFRQRYHYWYRVLPDAQS